MFRLLISTQQAGALAREYNFCWGSGRLVLKHSIQKYLQDMCVCVLYITVSVSCYLNKLHSAMECGAEDRVQVGTPANSTGWKFENFLDVCQINYEMLRDGQLKMGYK